jgi:hypothetical protein
MRAETNGQIDPDRNLALELVRDTSQHADSLDHLRRRYAVLVHVGDPVVDVARLDPSDRQVPNRGSILNRQAVE